MTSRRTVDDGDAIHEVIGGDSYHHCFPAMQYQLQAKLLVLQVDNQYMYSTCLFLTSIKSRLLAGQIEVIAIPSGMWMPKPRVCLMHSRPRPSYCSQEIVAGPASVRKWVLYRKVRKLSEGLNFWGKWLRRTCSFPAFTTTRVAFGQRNSQNYTLYRTGLYVVIVINSREPALADSGSPPAPSWPSL